MKRPTYAELTEKVTTLDREQGLLNLALNYTVNDKPDAVERFKGTHTGERYVLKLYGAARAHGGIVVKTFYFRGQRPQTSVYYLDEMSRGYFGTHLVDLANAIGRLVAVRNRQEGVDKKVVDCIDHTC